MKKILFFAVFALSVASAAFASDALTLSLDTTGLTVYASKTSATAVATDPLVAKTSTGVAVGMKTSADGYAAVTQHKSGSKGFGSSHDSTSIYSIPVTVTSGANVAITGPTAIGTALFTGSWTAM